MILIYSTLFFLDFWIYSVNSNYNFYIFVLMLRENVTHCEKMHKS